MRTPLRHAVTTMGGCIVIAIAAACGSKENGSSRDPIPFPPSHADPDAGEPDGGGAPEDGGTCNGEARVTIGRDAPPLAVTGEPGIGIADPSLFGTWMAFTSLPRNESGGAIDQGGLRTHIASTEDGGKTWRYVTESNHVVVLPDSADCKKADGCTSSIVNETPSLVGDGAEPDGARRWKLFTHRYLVKKVGQQPPAILYTVGHISMFTAPTPSGPWSAQEDVVAGWPGSDFSSSGAKYLPANAPATQACGVFGEPGATIAPDGSLHLALSCITPPFGDPTLDIVMLRSVDHGATWSYLATPLRGAEVGCFGGAGKRVNAASPFVVGGVEYLIATPEGPNTRDGCIVVPFADSAKGILRRDAAGRIAPSRHLAPIFDMRDKVHYAGACSYAPEAPATGFTMSRLVIDSTSATFYEFATGVLER